ncbi:hypothetical protein OC709_02090 ['Planchonia careya' phytoplasma]|nr:hypothetical protein ['Planchonia careya' phytoplasma]
MSSVVDRVQTIVTPGNTIDILVTDLGIAVNPIRTDLLMWLKSAGIVVKDICELRDLAYSIVGKPLPINYDNRVIALIEYRDGIPL